jgi:hypothetical protein
MRWSASGAQALSSSDAALRKLRLSTADTSDKDEETVLAIV